MRVVLDACVLYPPSLRDLLLTLAALDALEVRWSEEILGELVRNVVADHPDITADRFEGHTIAAMRRHFPEALVSIDAATVARLDNHPKDRHVAAIALTVRATGIVTLNVKDFESEVLAAAGVVVLTPGALIDRLLDDSPEAVVDAIRRIASRLRNPPMTSAELMVALSKHPTMAQPINRLAALHDAEAD